MCRRPQDNDNNGEEDLESSDSTKDSWMCLAAFNHVNQQICQGCFHFPFEGSKIFFFPFSSSDKISSLQKTTLGHHSRRSKVRDVAKGTDTEWPPFDSALLLSPP